jgi:hypothetical protein
MRIWSWSDNEHLTKLETKMFPGAITHVDWDAESKTILALGDGVDSNSIAKSLTFDTTVHTSSPKGSPFLESRNLFLSSLSQREKLTMSFSNEKNTASDHIGPTASHQAGFTQGYISPIRGENSFMPVPSSSSKHYQEQNMKSPPSSPIPPPPIYLPKDIQPFSPNGTKPLTPTPSSSGSVLERLRAVEAHFPLQHQHNTSIEAKLNDIDGEFAKFNVDVSTSLQDLQKRFERDMKQVHRESENR